MGRPLLDMRGQVFHRLTVLEWVGRVGNGSLWRCRCECGKITDVQRSGLVSGSHKSCGCYKRDRASTLTLKHGRRKCGSDGLRIKCTEYKIWDGMKQRCHNEKDPGFADYGGRGVIVCDEWRYDFDAFFAHIGPRPSPKHSVDRFPDMDGPYAHGNVRWATQIEQCRNKRNNRLVEVNGVMMPISAAVEIVGLRKHVIRKRLNSGWSVRDALWTPLDMRKSHVNCS